MSVFAHNWSELFTKVRLRDATLKNEDAGGDELASLADTQGVDYQRIVANMDCER